MQTKQQRSTYIKEWKRRNRERITVRAEKVCIVCSKVFTAQFSWGQTRNTCSDKCRYTLTSKKLSNKISRNCKQCGRPFVVIPSSQKVCCSPTCQERYMSNLFTWNGNPNWKETKATRLPNKKSLRNHIKRRDKACQDCGSQEDLHIHHKDSNPSNNSEDNLVLLCKVCHSIRHKEMNESNLVGLILASRTYSSLPKIKCPICDTIFQPKRKKSICCSPKCGRIQSGITRRIN